MMNRKHKRFEQLFHFLVLVSAIAGCISVSAFASLLGVSIGITSSAIGLKTCAIDEGIKKYESIIHKKKKKRDKIVFIAKYKLNSIESLISEALINTDISHDEFVSKNNLPKEYDDMKEEIKNV